MVVGGWVGGGDTYLASCTTTVRFPVGRRRFVSMPPNHDAYTSVAAAAATATATGSGSVARPAAVAGGVVASMAKTKRFNVCTAHQRYRLSRFAHDCDPKELLKAVVLLPCAARKDDRFQSSAIMPFFFSARFPCYYLHGVGVD